MRYEGSKNEKIVHVPSSRKGGLIAKAGLDSWPPATLLGALMELKKESHPETLQRWNRLGATLMEDESELLILIFKTLPTPQQRLELKKRSFLYNPLRKEWTGQGNLQELEQRFPQAAVMKPASAFPKDQTEPQKN